MRYYVLKTPAGDEVVRLSRGSASYFDAAKGQWISDPLLAVEVRMNGDWRPVEPHELPAGVADHAGQLVRGRKTRLLRRGRHSRR